MIVTTLQNYFNKKNVFTRDELFHFYLLSEQELNKNTFAWRIYNLKRKGIIKQVGRGLYSLQSKSNYSLELSADSTKIAQSISKTFTEINFCISDSTWINEFTSHQYSSNFTIVEVEKDFLESVFFNLKETTKNVFLKPNETELDRYISDLESAIILIPFITRTPIREMENQNFNTPTIEKLLVDIYIKNSPYFFLTNSEIETIIQNAFRKYIINQTTLLAYAERRGKKNEIKNFLIKKKLIEVMSD
ncbi:MAG: hypothetical protein HND52_19290 [Ignavibacteriae bacterium]|nr:hypothetical protein [Ignavibacteriota bacterium]NOH00112.1 hypothetical protein [Ignavibacteriota bacterium]